MKTRTLGKTGLQVSELSMGGLFISSVGGEYEQAKAAILKSLDLGINYLDTAPSYLNSEDVFGRALENNTKPLIFSTKLGGRPQPFDAQNKSQLRQSVEESLRLLKRDYIDILFIHEPDRPGQYAWWTDLENYDGPVMELLEELKEEGIIHYTGIGGTTTYEMARIIQTGRFDVLLTAFNYSLLWREAERYVLPAAKEQNMGIVIGSALQQGSLAARHDEELRAGIRGISPPRREQFLKLYELLDELQMPLPELAFRFVLSNPDISCVLMGARSSKEVEQNVAAVEKGPLAHEILNRLDEIATMVSLRPFDEPAGLSFSRDYPGAGVMR